MTPQDSAAEVMARLRSDLGALDPAVHGEDLDAATNLALDDLDSLAQQLEKLREEREDAIHECDLRAEESAAANRLLTDLRTHLVAAEAERNAALTRVEAAEKALAERHGAESWQQLEDVDNERIREKHRAESAEARVQKLEEALRLISDGCKLARDDLRPELARIEEVADRALGGSDA